MIYLLAAFGSCVLVFLKGIQVQNITHSRYLMASVTSYVLAAADILMIGLIVKGGWDMFLPIGTGGTIGIVASMYVHKRWVFKRG